MKIEQGKKMEHIIRNTPSEPIAYSKEPEEVKVPKGDQYQFTMDAKELQEIFTAAKQYDGIRHEKIQAIKEKIASGERVSGYDIVRKVMGEKSIGSHGD